VQTLRANKNQHWTIYYKENCTMSLIAAIICPSVNFKDAKTNATIEQAQLMEDFLKRHEIYFGLAYNLQKFDKTLLSLVDLHDYIIKKINELIMGRRRYTRVCRVKVAQCVY
jgi:hypothetical protein